MLFTIPSECGTVVHLPYFLLYCDCSLCLDSFTCSLAIPLLDPLLFSSDTHIFSHSYSFHFYLLFYFSSFVFLSGKRSIFSLHNLEQDASSLCTNVLMFWHTILERSPSFRAKMGFFPRKDDDGNVSAHLKRLKIVNLLQTQSPKMCAFSLLFRYFHIYVNTISLLFHAFHNK